MEPRRRAVMADVARLAGVSKQTVSRVLNDHPHVHPETRQRVRAAVEELSYRRDAAARALVTRRTGVLGILAFDTTLHGPVGTIAGMQQVASDHGYFLTISSLSSRTDDRLGQALDRLYEQAVDGVVAVASTRSAAALLDRFPEDLPLVTIEATGARRADSIRVDQEASGRGATTHLLELGHEVVHHIAGPSDRIDAAARVAGWRSALEEAGIAVPEPAEGDWTPVSGYEAAQRLIERGGVSAIFAANDGMALGALHALRTAGIDVPGQVSIVGLDDLPEAAFAAPPLTTIRHDFRDLGEQSIRMLLERIADPDRGSRQVVLEPSLVVRASSDHPA